MKNAFTKLLLGLMLTVGVLACAPIETGVLIHGQADKKANRNYPTAVKIFALGSDHLFYSYDFFTLTLEPEAVLGVTLRKVLDEVEIAPGDNVVFGPYSLPANTRNIGVIGTFQAGERAKWRDTAAVTPNSTDGLNQEIYVIIKGNEIHALTKAEYNQALTAAQEAAKLKAEEEAAEKAAAEEAAKIAAEKKAAAEKAAKEAEEAAKKAAEAAAR